MGLVHEVRGGPLARNLRRATGRQCRRTDAATGRSEALGTSLRSASSPAVPFRGAPIDDGGYDDDADDVGDDDAGSA